MTSKFKNFTKFALPILAVMAFAPVANASNHSEGANNTHITCDNEFQNINGSWISTPQCQNQHLSNVARSYGKSVSAKQLRQTPAMKYELCDLIGHDTRLTGICNAQSEG